MSLKSRLAFTLIEMLTVMAVIAILASLIVSVNAYAHKKAALVRAEAEIKTMSAACESYKADNGSYPRDSSQSAYTDTLCPVLDGDPRKTKYQDACLVLYKSLSGDSEANGKPKEKSYCEFRPDQLKKNPSGEIQFIQDPFGNSYGYSTTGAATEELYRTQLEKKADAARPKKSGGFNPTFDLWSTSGVISSETDVALNPARKQWSKNW